MGNKRRPPVLSGPVVYEPPFPFRSRNPPSPPLFLLCPAEVSGQSTVKFVDS